MVRLARAEVFDSADIAIAHFYNRTDTSVLRRIAAIAAHEDLELAATLDDSADLGQASSVKNLLL